MIEASTTPAGAFVTAALIAIAAQILAMRLKTPPILLWLLAGIALGPFGAHLLHVESLREALHPLVELGLAIILFEGGLNLNLKAMREYGRTVARLVILGPLVTTVIAATAAHHLADMDWPLALLFGALVSVGGPTVIMPIVRQMRLGRTIGHILTGEAMLIDVVGAILAIVLLQVALAPDTSAWHVLQAIVTKAVFGASVGLLGGWGLSWLLRREWLIDSEVRTILTLVSAWVLFILADHLSEQAGLLAMLVTGAVLQRMELPDLQRLRHFKGSLSMLLISVLFVLLAANLDLSLLSAHLGTGLVIFAILALLARPLAVWLACLGDGPDWREQAYLAGMAPRGVVAAAVTSLFALVLSESGHAQADLMLALVYLVIIASVLFYSLIAAPLKHWLGIQGANDRSVLIVGGGQVGAEIGRALGEDREVRFLDLNAEVVRNLQRSGFFAVRGNALDPLYLELVHAEEVSAILVMTGSSDHNLLIARLAHDMFHIPEIYVALQEGDEEKHASLIHQLRARRLFAKPYTFTYWNVQAWLKRLVYETRIIEPDSPLVGLRMADARIPHGVQPIAVIRDERTLIPHDDLRFEAGDEVKMLLRPERIQEGQPLILPPPPEHSVARLEDKGGVGA
ncbi:MAG: cation:proton antiporter [Mariprofundaceae bacterium]